MAEESELRRPTHAVTNAALNTELANAALILSKRLPLETQIWCEQQLGNPTQKTWEHIHRVYCGIKAAVDEQERRECQG